MSMLLTLLPASSEHLDPLRSEPARLSALYGDSDRITLHHGGVARPGSATAAVHAALTQGDPGSVLGFLEVGGVPIGSRARGFREKDTAAIAESFAAHAPSDPSVADAVAELGALLQSTSDARSLLVVRTGNGAVDVHLVGDAAIDRYVADPALLDAHLAAAPASPDDAVVLHAWYALQVALNECGDSPAHRFVEDGGELLDEGAQLRVFSAAEVEAIRDVLAAIEPATLRGALGPRQLDREGLDAEEADLAASEFASLRTTIGSWADAGRAMISFMR